MPARVQPTARQVRLGAELRKLREAAGQTSRQAAALLGTNPAQMSQIEAGNAGVSGERVRKLAVQYSCADAELIDALMAMATDRTRGWWEEYRDVLPLAFQDLAELEHHARFMWVAGAVYVPGLLQTEEYARAVYEFWNPGLPERDVQLRVENRLRRAVVLTREGAVPYKAMLHESVLRTRVADRRVARDQLDWILHMSERSNITVRVIPFDVDGFGGAGMGMLYAGGPVAALDTVQQDTPSGAEYVDDADRLRAVRHMYGKVEAASLDPTRSRDYIRRLAKEL